MTVLNFELTIEQANALLNALNMPSQTPATTAVFLINLLQEQAAPQIAQIRKEEEENEPKAAS